MRQGQLFDCGPGVKYFGGRRLEDVKPNHTLDLEGVLVNSSNIGMAQVGRTLGIRPMGSLLRGFGFGATTGVPVAGESGGWLTPLAKWHADYTLVSVSMGHEIQVSPIQMATALSALAAGGRYRAPRLVAGEPRGPERDLGLSASAIEFSRSAMVKVVEEGTGKPALALFSRQGYRATSMREIADRAGVSTGRVYHQFKDKEAIFLTLLDVYWQAIEDQDFPINRALRTGSFPENLEDIGRAARESVARYRPYVTLIYVDVVEFEGSHIRKFYSEMAGRFERFIDAHRDEIKLEGKLRPDIQPASAVMSAFRTFLQHFAVELIFGVPDHYGKSTEEAVSEIANIMNPVSIRAL